MSLAEYAAEHGLHRVGARPPLRRYLAEAWERRDFAVTMAKFKIQAANERNKLGMLWIVLQPLLNAAVYGVIFGVLQGSSRPADYTPYLLIGVFLFQYFSHSLNKGAKSITGNQALVQSLAFPRITLPVSVVLQELFDLIPMLGVLGVLLMLLGHYPSWSWLLIVPLLVIYTLFNAGIAFIAARLTVHLRDVTQILPFIQRFLFYTSGVLFAVDKIFKGHPLIERIFDFHPLYEVLQLARGALMHTRHVPTSYWLYLSVWAVAVFGVGLVFFWVAEERYGRAD